MSSSSESVPPTKRKKHRVKRSWPARITIATLRLIFFGYLAILVALTLMEERLFYPGAFIDGSQDRVSSNGGLSGGLNDGLNDGLIETVPIESSVKVTVPARLLHRENARRFVLFFHGNAEKAKSLDAWMTKLSELMEATVMAAEYRGYEDDVTPTERGVLDDCFAARNYLCSRYRIKPDEIILYGRSLGGGCAVAVAARDGAKALILEKTFDRAYAVAAARYPWVPIRILMKNRFDSLAKMTTYEGPLIQIHGDVDRIIPVAHGRRLYDSAVGQPQEWIEVPGMDHNDPLPSDVLQRVASWIDGLPENETSHSNGANAHLRGEASIPE